MDFNICQLNCQDTIDSKIIRRLGLRRLPKPPSKPWCLGGDAEVLIRADFYKLRRVWFGGSKPDRILLALPFTL